MADSLTTLLAFVRTGQPEIHSPLVVGLGRGRQVQVRQRNLLRMLRSEVPQRLPYDGIVLYFQPALIAEHQHRGWSGFRTLGFMRRRRRRPRINILIALLAHPLLIKALLVHLVGQANLVLLVLIVRRAGIPPPIRIEQTVTPRITAAADIAGAVIPQAVGANSDAAGMVEAPRGERRARSGTARG